MSQNELKSDLKSPRCLSFGANLTHFGLKSGHLGLITENQFIVLPSTEESVGQLTYTTGMGGVAPKWVRLAPNGINPVLFQIKFQYILALEPKCTEI